MSLIIPTSFSHSETYGDSTSTEGAPLSKYVLAQYRSDADLNWVGELRASLVKDELKYKHFREARPRLKQKRKFWKRIEKGVGQASIIIIDPAPVYDWVESLLEEAGAEKGIDYNEQKIIEECGTALVGITPIAYLPETIHKLIPWSMLIEVSSFDSYLPENLKKQLGGKLKDAKIFAARAHAAFDLKSIESSQVWNIDEVQPSLEGVFLQELASTVRIFDKEHPKSADILNKAINTIIRGIGRSYPLWPEEKLDTFVKEYDSRAVSEIQAADIGAGWAREILDASNPQSLCTMFDRVWYNGIKLK